ncbi:hypothetical protein HII36_26960 [Nonomuraea sp. NN258]|uniref:hypothetical protein n=1 Tax=Nonomuraea antri TaxID=2730852 RepID=UPI001568C3E5|nr:hypothetical protein [Nonomuraea antri]NRQ35442.1 hypothetical protein [Nonomuraea antri]
MAFRASPNLAAVLVVTTVLLVPGCSAPEPVPTPPPARLEDRGPYWCGLVPLPALRVMSGYAAPLSESSGGVPETHGQCSLDSDYRRFSLTWGSSNADTLLRVARDNYDSADPSPLPADLGEGLFAYTGRTPDALPYHATMVFRCGKRRPWFSMGAAEVAKGRDAYRDFMELLRIARTRFGVIHGCAPAPK